MAVFILTLGEMRAEVYARLGEVSGNSRWDDTIIDRWLNLGQTEVVRKTRCLEEDYTVIVPAYTSAGDEVLAFQNNLFMDGIHAIWWVDSDDNMARLRWRIAKFDSIKNTDTGTPSSAFSIGNNIHLMPLPVAAGTVRIIGERMPNALTADSDVSLLPPSWRDLPVMYAVLRATTEDHEFVSRQLVEQEYREGLRDLKKATNLRRARMRQPRFVIGGRRRSNRGQSIDGHSF